MILASHELLRHNPKPTDRGNPPRARRQHVPVHRLPEHRARGPRAPRRCREATMSTRIFGSGIRRREDPRLITGTALYTDDFTLPGMVHAAMLRSPHAHARITQIDVSRAKAGARRRGGLHRRRHRRAEADAVRVAAAQRRPQDRRRTRASRRTSSATSATSSPSSSPRRRIRRYDALDLIDVDYEPLPARDRSAEGAAGRARRSCTPTCRTTKRSTGRSPAATSTRRSRTPTSSSRSASSSSG